MAAAADAFREEMCPFMGMLTKKSQFSATRRLMPSPSEPMTMAAGPFRSALYRSVEAPAAVPEDIDLAIVPCVGAAADGRRLGRGGGYHDRFLARYTGSALLLCREKLLCPDIPREAHDICMPAVITEKGRLGAAG